jgi:hypothetical protein
MPSPKENPSEKFTVNTTIIDFIIHISRGNNEANIPNVNHKESKRLSSIFSDRNPPIIIEIITPR